MEGAQCFIEVYKISDTGEVINSPNYNENSIHVSPIDNLNEDLILTKSCSAIQTIAVWYIKPKKSNP